MLDPIRVKEPFRSPFLVLPQDAGTTRQASQGADFKPQLVAGFTRSLSLSIIVDTCGGLIEHFDPQVRFKHSKGSEMPSKLSGALILPWQSLLLRAFVVMSVGNATTESTFPWYPRRKPRSQSNDRSVRSDDAVFELGPNSFGRLVYRSKNALAIVG